VSLADGCRKHNGFPGLLTGMGHQTSGGVPSPRVEELIRYEREVLRLPLAGVYTGEIPTQVFMSVPPSGTISTRS
jgi:hypothetical protein